jgi:hypothetical protein
MNCRGLLPFLVVAFVVVVVVVLYEVVVVECRNHLIDTIGRNIIAQSHYFGYYCGKFVFIVWQPLYLLPWMFAICDVLFILRSTTFGLKTAHARVLQSTFFGCTIEQQHLPRWSAI